LQWVLRRDWRYIVPRNPALLSAAVLVIVAAATGACDVERTSEAAAPDVDVQVDPGRWPRYEVRWADVDVGTTERTVTVPVIRVVEEERQVTVPYIDINPPGAGEREERTISMDVNVPHAGYELVITEVRAAEDDLWVIARLTESSGAAAQVMTRVEDRVVVNVPEDLDVRKVVVGERPPGVYNQQYRFIDSMAALQEELPDGARVIYQRGDAGAASGV
jgi:hypothetical protein